MSRCVALRGLGIVAPGLDGWESSAPILAGESAYPQDGPLPPVSSGLLTPIQRRRTTATTRLALKAGAQAIAHSGLTPDRVCTLFSSSDGDMEVADTLCRALAMPDHPVSPTQFHNSVHNAPAAYWSIATGSKLPSTSISVYSASFTSGLLEAAVFAHAEGREVLFVAYNYPAPHPMSLAVSVRIPFAIAMVLSPDCASMTLGSLHLKLSTGLEEARMTDPGLERLRQGSSAAHCLPLLSAIARAAPQAVAMPYLHETRLVAKHEAPTDSLLL